MTKIKKLANQISANFPPHQATVMLEYVETQISELEDELRQEMDTLEQSISSLVQRLDNV